MGYDVFSVPRDERGVPLDPAGAEDEQHNSAAALAR